MRRSSFVFVLALASKVATAGPTGLALIPIADIVKHREGFAYVGLQGTERNISKGYSFFNSATVGLFDRVEIGYDNDFLGGYTYNVKLQIFESPKQLPGASLSVGVMNANGGYREPYVVGRYDMKGYRLHGGYWNTMGAGRGFFGADFPVFAGTGSVEFISGDGSQTWASLYWPIDAVPGLGIFASVGFPSRKSDGIQHMALLLYSFRL